MYITENHICFYAYLPKKSVRVPPSTTNCTTAYRCQNVIAKSGYLSKKGKQTRKYSRYWFTLKGDVLSYYTDPSALYFPSGNIDLRYGISAALSSSKEKGKDVTSFTVTTHQRTYYFKADSPASAKEWVKTLQKVIFRSHNDGDSVKISLPIQNVIDIEESPVVDFAETVKIRIVDSDETYAIDEVCTVSRKFHPLANWFYSISSRSSALAKMPSTSSVRWLTTQQRRSSPLIFSLLPLAMMMARDHATVLDALQDHRTFVLAVLSILLRQYFVITFELLYLHPPSL